MRSINFCFIIVTVFLCRVDVSSQTTDTVAPPIIVVHENGDTLKVNDTTERDHSFVEIMPVYPGGNDAFVKYLQENIRYPKAEKRAGKQGTVYVSFIVNKDGSVSDVEVRKGVQGAPGLGAEAVRVLKAMPNWEPGTMNGRPVRVQMTQPITFTLTGGRKGK